MYDRLTIVPSGASTCKIYNLSNISGSVFIIFDGLQHSFFPHPEIPKPNHSKTEGKIFLEQISCVRENNSLVCECHNCKF